MWWNVGTMSNNSCSWTLANDGPLRATRMILMNGVCGPTQENWLVYRLHCSCGHSAVHVVPYRRDQSNCLFPREFSFPQCITKYLNTIINPWLPSSKLNRIQVTCRARDDFFVLLNRTSPWSWEGFVHHSGRRKLLSWTRQVSIQAMPRTYGISEHGACDNYS